MHQLSDTIFRLSSYLEPQPTEIDTQVEPLEDIRAVIFDVYGTLFISGSGDISLAAAEDREEVARECLADCGFELLNEDVRISELFLQTIQRHQEERRRDGIEFPEVEIREVWEELLSGLITNGAVECTLCSEAVQKLAVIYEVRVNPVWPMPNLRETLEVLARRDLVLGIVSNAQFFTPMLFEAFLGESLSGLGFDENARVWSYKMREGKPSTALYEKLAHSLKALEITPEQTLYVGNDIRNDVWPAQATGFKTALFAGDKRSLRLREDDPNCGNVQADRVVKDLYQIPEKILKK